MDRMPHPLCFILILLASGFLAPFAAAQEEPLPLWHFKPRDHALGDVHPYFHEGQCFLYYLKPGKYDSALACSPDLLRWRETPLTHAGAKADDWMSPYFVLGVFREPGSEGFRSFFGHREGRMASSVSTDLRHWACAPKAFHLPPADYYQRRRDPFVFWIPEQRQFGCVMTAWMKGRPKETGGAVCLATSPDLKTWRDHGAILDPGTIGEPECPQMFPLGGCWILLASIYDRAVGQPVYWTSSSPLGPWKPEPAGQLDGKDLCAAQIAFDGEVPLLFGWIPLKPATPGAQHWGGHLALPREVHVLADGRLGTRLAARVARAFAALPWQTVPDFTAKAQASPVPGAWTRLAVKFTVTLPRDASTLHIDFAPLGRVELRRDELRILDATGGCWSSLPCVFPSGDEVSVSLFIEEDMVEVFAGDRCSLAARLPAQPGRLSLSLRTEPSEMALKGIQVSEWRLAK